MEAADFEALKGKIALPDFDKYLVPLMLYRGSQSLGRMSRLWNFAVTCMESGVESFGQMTKLSHNPDFAHLAGPQRPVQMSTLPGLMGRLRDNQFVTDNVPGFSKWVRQVRGRHWHLTPISIYTNERNHADRFAPWRINDYRPEVKAERELTRLAKEGVRAEKRAEADGRRQARQERVAERRREKLLGRNPQERLFYPYLAYRPGVAGDEAALVMEVNNAVARGLPDWLRADICQDLIVGVLSGEIGRAALSGSVREATGKVLKLHPLKYGPLSIDAPMFDDGEVTFIDSLAVGAA